MKFPVNQEALRSRVEKHLNAQAKRRKKVTSERSKQTIDDQLTGAENLALQLGIDCICHAEARREEFESSGTAMCWCRIMSNRKRGKGDPLVI